MSTVYAVHLDFEGAVRMLGRKYKKGKTFVRKNGKRYIIHAPGIRREIEQVTFRKLCNEACISHEGEHFVPTEWCRKLSQQLTS